MDKEDEPKEESFAAFLKTGGFPALPHFDQDLDVIYQYIGSLYNTILLKDVVKRNNLRNVALLENIVFLELRRRGYTVHIGKLDTHEIDFIATRANEKIYLQVAYLLASEETIQREFKPLLQIQDNYPKYVLSMDTLFGNDYEGIQRLNLIDFLLQKPNQEAL